MARHSLWIQKCIKLRTKLRTSMSMDREDPIKKMRREKWEATRREQ